MDFDSLLVRTPVSDRPLSMLVRLPTTAALGQVLRRIICLLEGRRSGDEVVLILPDGNDYRLPCRMNGIRIRTIQQDSPFSGPALSEGLEACRRPTIVTVDENVSLTPAELTELTQRLDVADVVCGKRRLPRWSRLSPVAWLASTVFSSAVSDPLCPIRAYRRSAVAGMVLQTTSPLLEFETVAKMTFLVSLLDEVDLEMPYREPSVGQAMLQCGSELRSLFLQPQFWNYAGSGTERPALHQESLPVKTTSRSSDKQKLLTPTSGRMKGDWGPMYPQLVRSNSTIAVSRIARRR